MVLSLEDRDWMVREEFSLPEEFCGLDGGFFSIFSSDFVWGREGVR